MIQKQTHVVLPGICDAAINSIALAKLWPLSKGSFSSLLPLLKRKYTKKKKLFEINLFRGHKRRKMSEE